MESIIRDISLAKSGHEKISWVDRHMPALNAIGYQLKADQTFKERLFVSVFIWKLKRHISQKFFIVQVPMSSSLGAILFRPKMM